MGLAEFSEIILNRRRELKLTQEQVARKVGVHANYIGYLERGLRRPGDQTLVALCEALELDKAQLFATLNPLFRDIVKAEGADDEDDDALPPALRELIEDRELLRELGTTEEQARKLAVLRVFGEVERKQDYVRILKTLAEILE